MERDKSFGQFAPGPPAVKMAATVSRYFVLALWISVRQSLALQITKLQYMEYRNVWHEGTILQVGFVLW